MTGRVGWIAPRSMIAFYFTGIKKMSHFQHFDGLREERWVECGCKNILPAKKLSMSVFNSAFSMTALLCFDFWTKLFFWFPIQLR